MADIEAIAHSTTTLSLDAWGLINEKTLKGSFLGSATIFEDVPRLIELYSAGELLLEELVSDRIALADLPEAFDRLRAGEAVRQVVVFDAAG